jgi:hypothetical protein
MLLSEYIRAWWRKPTARGPLVVIGVDTEPRAQWTHVELPRSLPVSRHGNRAAWGIVEQTALPPIDINDAVRV